MNNIKKHFQIDMSDKSQCEIFHQNLENIYPLLQDSSNQQIFSNQKLQIVAFNNITLKIEQKDQQKIILNNISGQIKSGYFTAIMGPTGSGKSSLLNALSGRLEFIKNAEFSGQIFQNNKMIKNSLQKASYVMQNDIFLSHLTVKETFMYTAHFYLSKQMNYQEIEQYVIILIKNLGLIQVQNTIIGCEKQRGISGGEKKRVNIGVEMIQNPEILFLDEPTSGLDSFQALSVCQSLQELAHKQNKTILSSIHQPCSRIVDLFDNLILLSRGEIVYQGPFQYALDYFEEQGYKCPKNFNKTDFFLDLISIDYSSQQLEQQSIKRIDRLITIWKERQEDYKFIDNEQQDCQKQNDKKNIVYQSTFFTQLKYLLIRQFMNRLRDKSFILISIFIQIAYSLIIGSLYSKKLTGYRQMQDNLGLLFFITTNQSYGVMINVLNIFNEEKIVVQKEIQSNAYHLSAYYISKIISDIPFHFIGPIIYCCIIYWMVNLDQDFQKFLNFLVIILIQVQISVCLGICLSAYSDNIQFSAAFGAPIITISVQFAGVFINLASIPIVIKWIQYISFIRWSIQALAINEFQNKIYEIIPTDHIQLDTGNKFLIQYGYDKCTLIDCMLYNGYILIILLFSGFFLLKLNKKQYMKFK